MITIPTADLVGILADVIPFASTDKDLPAVNSVQLEWDGEQLHALTTDRYRVAISTWQPDDDPDGEVQEDLFTKLGGGDDPWTTLIPLDDAKDLVSNYKLPAKEQYAPLTVDYDLPRNRLKVARSRDTGHSAITTIIDTRFDIFPDVRQHLANADVVEKVEQIHYDAKRLADFAKVRPRGPMQLRFTGETGMTHIAIGERFIGAIMPIRLGDHDEPTEQREPETVPF